MTGPIKAVIPVAALRRGGIRFRHAIISGTARVPNPKALCQKSHEHRYKEKKYPSSHLPLRRYYRLEPPHHR
jgi:hypothetical protein